MRIGRRHRDVAKARHLELRDLVRSVIRRGMRRCGTGRSRCPRRASAPRGNDPSGKASRADHPTDRVVVHFTGRNEGRCDHRSTRLRLAVAHGRGSGRRSVGVKGVRRFGVGRGIERLSLVGTADQEYEVVEAVTRRRAEDVSAPCCADVSAPGAQAAAARSSGGWRVRRSQPGSIRDGYSPSIDSRASAASGHSSRTPVWFGSSRIGWIIRAEGAASSPGSRARGALGGAELVPRVATGASEATARKASDRSMRAHPTTGRAVARSKSLRTAITGGHGDPMRSRDRPACMTVRRSADGRSHARPIVRIRPVDVRCGRTRPGRMRGLRTTSTWHVRC